MSISSDAPPPAMRPIGATPTPSAGLHKDRAWSGALDVFKSVVRRSPQVMQFYRGRDVPLARGRFNFDAPRMDAIIAANRKLLSGFGSWVDAEAMQRSKYAYGLSPDWALAMEREIGPKMTYSDLLCYAAIATGSVSYLEIGVSVGKNFWQVLNQARNSSLVAMDIEEINPPLRQRLVPVDAAECGAAVPRLDRFRFTSHDNDVCYATGDVFDPALWDKLAGRKFNLLFSDAFHDPAAVMYEWEKIVELDLLDRAGFTIVWDDLVSRPIRRVFNTIIQDCIARYGLTPRNATLMHAGGWVGEFEPAHPIGVISTQGFVA